MEHAVYRGPVQADGSAAWCEGHRPEGLEPPELVLLTVLVPKEPKP